MYANEIVVGIELFANDRIGIMGMWHDEEGALTGVIGSI